jgi:DNA-directed RNA polymerase subunit M/transcription elongation factor TFIIS
MSQFSDKMLCCPSCQRFTLKPGDGQFASYLVCSSCGEKWEANDPTVAQFQAKGGNRPQRKKTVPFEQCPFCGFAASWDKVPEYIAAMECKFCQCTISSGNNAIPIAGKKTKCPGCGSQTGDQTWEFTYQNPQVQKGHCESCGGKWSRGNK